MSNVDFVQDNGQLVSPPTLGVSVTNVVPCNSGIAYLTYFEPYTNDLQGRSIKPVTGAWLPAITVCRQSLSTDCPVGANHQGPVGNATNQALKNRLCNKSVNHG